ncbi:MAG TPA: hypothetical protein VMV18_01520, partial [bacterium]|nr:hypothetical protein [bacterium]
KGEPPLKLDSSAPKVPLFEYMRNEARFRMTEKLDRDRYKQLLEWAQTAVDQRFAIYEQLSKLVVPQTTHLPNAEPLPEEPAEGGV